MTALFKEAIAKLLDDPLCDEGDREFLCRLRDDSNQNIDRIWRGCVDDGGIDTAGERVIFIMCLLIAWTGSWLSEHAAMEIRSRRTLAKQTAKLGRFVAKEAAAGRVYEVGRLMAEVGDLLRQGGQPSEWSGPLREILEIRSDRKGSRRHTAFVRMASSYFQEETGQPHDDWVASLAEVAFFPVEFSAEDVYSARRDMKPLKGWWRTHSDLKMSSLF